jgi:hypothetical protein
MKKTFSLKNIEVVKDPHIGTEVISMQNMGTEVISMQNIWQHLLGKPGPNVTGNATKGNKAG